MYKEPLTYLDLILELSYVSSFIFAAHTKVIVSGEALRGKLSKFGKKVGQQGSIFKLTLKLDNGTIITNP